MLDGTHTSQRKDYASISIAAPKPWYGRKVAFSCMQSYVTSISLSHLKCSIIDYLSSHFKSLLSLSRSITSRASTALRGVAVQHSSIIGFISSNTDKDCNSKNGAVDKAIALPIRRFSSSEEFKDGKPTLKYASTLTGTWTAMSNDQILHFAHMDVPEACRECVIRDVMVVDQIDYDEVRTTDWSDEDTIR